MATVFYHFDIPEPQVLLVVYCPHACCGGNRPHWLSRAEAASAVWFEGVESMISRMDTDHAVNANTVYLSMISISLSGLVP